MTPSSATSSPWRYRLPFPLHLADLAELQGETRAETIAQWRHAAARVIPEQGDAILYRGKRTAQAFTVLARGLAALATHAGGVVFVGLTWCALHSPGGTPGRDAMCQQCLAAELAGHDPLALAARGRGEA